MAQLNTHIVILFACFFALSCALNLMFYIYSKQRNKVKKKSLEKRWAPPKPTLGGIAVFLTIVVGWIVWGYVLDTPLSNWEWKVLGATCLAFVMGRYDDVRSVRPLYKLLFQITCAYLVVDSSHTLPFFQAYDSARMVLSMVWMIAIMNSMNMLDNMDGISGGVGMVIAFGLGVAGLLISGEWTFMSLNMMVLGSALLGFLVFNWNPSKLYMGDAGSMVLGLLLAVGAMSVFSQASSEHPLYAAGILILLFATPLLDTILVTINRLSAGTSPAKGGRDHSTHQLAYIGFSDRGIAGIFLALCAIQTIIATYLLVSPQHHTYKILIVIVLYLCVHFISLWWISRKNLQKEKYTY